MGFMDSVRGVFGGGSSSGDSNEGGGGAANGFDEDALEEEFSMSDEEFDETFEEDVEEEDREWENAYQCFDELIQYQGFSGANEFMARFMSMKVKGSDKYRDRIAIGRETAKMVEGAVSDLESIGKDGSESTPMGELATKIEDANRVKGAMEEFTDKDEQAFASGIVTANKAIDVAKEWVNTRETTPSVSGGRVEESDDTI